MEPELVQGQSTQLTIIFNLNKSYTMQYIGLSLAGMPQGVQAWINPQQLYSYINKNYTQYAQIPIYVNSGTASGNYTINVIANGNMVNETSNKEISFNYQRIGSINLVIKPATSPISVDIGQPEYTSTQFCTDTETSGHMCESFVGHEEFPITVHSDRPTMVRLDAQVPSGGYLKFIPDSFDVTSNGSSSRMIIAGIMEPFMINPLDTHPMTIKAISADSNIAIAYLPVIQSDNVTVLTSPAPISPVNSQLLTSGSQTAIIPFGVVYEPQADADSTLPVKLQALGIVNGSDIVPFTSSFSVKIPQDSFVLNASEPYYFMVEPISHSLPSGSITFAVGQEVGGQHFVQNVTLDISNVRYGESSIQVSSSQYDLQSTGPNSQNTGSNPLVATIGIGGIVGVGAGAISFFVLRRKPD
ncbi:MAG: hypothetical protein KGI27_11325 [Thaumarchaeota archaeon]|nr:hypothetical protein [Nitrososphaerota archaeon]